MLELSGKHGKSLPVEIGSGQKGFAPMKSECDGITAKVLEPGDDIFNSLYAHNRGAHLRTPAVCAFGGTAQGGDDHDVKRPFLFQLLSHHFFALLANF
jgi:hypothetical protein